MALHIHLVT